MQAHQPNLPNLPLNVPTINTIYTGVAVVTVAAAQDLIQSNDLTLTGAKKLFNPAVWPHLEPKVKRIPFNQQKFDCFQNAIAYLAADAVALQSQRKHFSALKRLEAKLLIEAILAEDTGNA